MISKEIALNAMLNKISKPSIEGLYNICEYLGVTFDEFFDVDSKYPNKIKELFNEVKRLKSDSLELLISIARKFD